MWAQEVMNDKYNIFSCYYTNGSGWGAPVQVQFGPDASEPQVGFDANGEATAMFKENRNLSACRNAPGSGWGAVQSIHSGSIAMMGHQLAVSTIGNAVAIWTQIEGDKTPPGPVNISVCASYYRPDSGWGPETSLFNIIAGTMYGKVAINDNGDRVVVWNRNYKNESSDDSHHEIYATCHLNGPGWLNPKVIHRGDGNAIMSSLRMSINNSATA